MEIITPLSHVMGRQQITLHPYGRIHFCKHAVEKLNLKANQRISFAFADGEMYIRRVRDESGFVLHRNKSCGSIRCNSKAVYQKAVEWLGQKDGLNVYCQLTGKMKSGWHVVKAIP